MVGVIRYDEENDIVLLRYFSDSVNSEDFIRGSQKAFRIGCEHGCKLCLIDNSCVKRLEEAQEFLLYPDITEQMNVPKDIKVALIPPKDKMINFCYQILAKAYREWGYCVRLFDEYKEALLWLHANNPPVS